MLEYLSLKHLAQVMAEEDDVLGSHNCAETLQTWTISKHASCTCGVAYSWLYGMISAGKGKMVEGMTSLPIAAAAEDPEGVMFDDDDDDNDDDDDEEEDLDAVD